MNSTPKKIVVVGGAQMGKMLAMQLVGLLEKDAGEVVVLDNIDKTLDEYVLRPMHFDLPAPCCVEVQESEFDKRQQWLDGFRAQHQKRARRSRK